MKKLNLLILICLCTLQSVFTQDLGKPKRDALDSLILKVESSLSHDWFVIKREGGFDVTFCRSCNDEYIDSMNNRPNYSREDFQKRALPKVYSRIEFLKSNGPDSVCYYPTVSLSYTTDTNEIRKSYLPNGIIKISVEIGNKWSDSKYNKIENKNNQLKEEIIKENLGKTNMSIFEDYRYWIPTQSWLLRRIENYKFSFAQLPYSSDWFNYSIFIKQDKPYQFCKVLLCNPKDRNYYRDKRNFIEHERTVALTSIAHALGIRDYKILN